jgi:uncharacterized membrane protein YdjX (TVP38/TMEM64 family)
MGSPRDPAPRLRCHVREVILAALWLLLLAAAIYGRTCHPTFLREELRYALDLSPALGCGIFLLLGSLRGFTLIPSTCLVALGLLLFPPGRLFVLAMTGIVLSSLSVYYFSRHMRLAALLEKNHSSQIESVRRALASKTLPAVICWSAAPFLPTDVICYVAGSLRIDVRRVILGVTIGESLTVATYVFVGHSLLQYGSSLLRAFS